MLVHSMVVQRGYIILRDTSVTEERRHVFHKYKAAVLFFPSK